MGAVKAEISGDNLVAGRWSGAGEVTFRSVDPRTEESGRVAFHEATADEIERAARSAGTAAGELRWAEPATLAGLLERIAEGLDAAMRDLIAMADRETGLGEQRLAGELARTSGQHRAFADMVRAGWDREPIIDRADGSGRPDVRRMLIPIGAVAVFGSSNFPLAFSVPGGDTASGLAAGCPVVAKGHPLHPGTSEVSARVIAGAVEAAGLPPGTFSMVQGAGLEVGRALVLAPEIRAVGFTGSLGGGRALHDLAATRPTPIPVFAEMGSVNPVFLTEAALVARGPRIAAELAASVALGTGQFCTKPGLMFVPPGDTGDGFVRSVAVELEAVEPGPMLGPAICSTFTDALERTSAVPGVEVVVDGAGEDGPGLWMRPSLVEASVETFLDRPEIAEEHFGPAAVVVRCPEARLPEAATRIQGSLTATVHLEPERDRDLFETLLPELSRFAGRIVFDGVPTGVAVVPAMQHGGPYPATTSPGHTSVGLTAIRRFLRPIAFQDAPEGFLPTPLRDGSDGKPLVNGRWTT